MNFHGLVCDVIAALDRLEVPCMLVGSWACNMYGVPRTGLDADLVVQPGDRSATELAKAVEDHLQGGPLMTIDAAEDTPRYLVLHSAAGFRIILFLMSNDAHDQQQLTRRRPAQLAGRTVYLPSPEDVIITKLRWSKGGNRSKDVNDVVNVLAVQAGTLDLPYIRDWTDHHGTRDLFERLLAAAHA